MKKLKLTVMLLVGVLIASCESENFSNTTNDSSTENQEVELKNGSITYTIIKVKNPTQDQKDAYAKINAAMQKAVNLFNKFTNRSRALTVEYNPSVPTADAVVGGSHIRFGSKRSFMNVFYAVHELHHIFGVGGKNWKARIKDGKYTGAKAKEVMKNFGGGANLNADGTHFWPYQFNTVKEHNSNHLDNSARLSEAFRLDGV